MANVDIDIDASELDDVVDNLARLGSNLESDEQELQQTMPEDMRKKILASIRRNFDDVRTGRGTSLLDAFYITRSADGKAITTVGTGAEHALPLEKGIRPHKIEGNPTLAFQPENIGDYPESSHAGGGYVVLDSVMWKPDKQETATGYEYVYEAQQLWEADVLRSLPQEIQSSIMSAGFKRKS